MNSFQLSGLSEQVFSSLFALSDDELAARNMRRVTANSHPGFPCRVSLVDAEIGEELLLLPYQHQPGASPYQSSGPIFVRRFAIRNVLPVGQLSPYVTGRMISLRGYDENDSMVSADLCEGTNLGAQIEGMLADERVSHVHLHNAKRGCFSCRVDRATRDASHA